MIPFPDFYFSPTTPEKISLVWSVYLIQDITTQLTDPLDIASLTKPTWLKFDSYHKQIQIYPTKNSEKGQYRVIVAHTYPKYNNSVQFTKFALTVKEAPPPPTPLP